VGELLVEDSENGGETATRAWIECNLMEIVRVGVHPDTRDLGNANRALETLAKLGGYLAERKVTDSRTVDLRQLETSELNAMLDACLVTLPPQQRAMIEAFMEGSDPACENRRGEISS
jgi:hypothetical protein